MPPQIDPKKRSAGGAQAAPATGAAPAGAAPAPAAQQQPVPGAGQPAQGAAPSPATPAGPAIVGTGFVNLQRVLQANRPGAEAMAGRVAGQVQQAGQQGQQAIQQGQQAFTDKTSAATLQYDPAKAPDKATAAQLAATTYKGPKDWEAAGVDVNHATRLATRASDMAGAVTSAGGRAALLRQGSAAPLSSGGAALDSYLTGEGLGAQAEQLQGSFGGLAAQLAAARGGSGAAYDAARAATAEAAGRYGQLAQGFQNQENAAADAIHDNVLRRQEENRLANLESQQRRNGQRSEGALDPIQEGKDRARGNGDGLDSERLGKRRRTMGGG